MLEILEIVFRVITAPGERGGRVMAEGSCKNESCPLERDERLYLNFHEVQLLS
jgi:hypothetical protein